MTKVRTSYGDGITRGGQLFLNRLKNANELILAAWKGMLALLVVGTLSFAFWQAPTYERYLLQRWTVAAFWANVSSNANKPIELRLEAKDGSISDQVTYVSADVFPQSPVAKQMLWGYVYRMIVGAIIMMLLNTVFLVYLIWQSKRDNDDAMDDKHVRGTPLGSELQVKRALKLTAAPGRVKVGPYTIPQTFETGHFLFLGGHGCGKTNAINRMCTGIRDGGHRAIVYDVAGTYIEKFYRPGKDTILNPLDDRGTPWTIWADVRIDAEYDYERIVQSLVPSDDPKSAFWYKGAQSLLKGVAKKLQVEGRTTNKALYDMLAKMELEELCFYCVGTEAGGVISPESERVSADIRATLLTAFTGFKYLRDAQPGSPLFSIREWMTREDDDSWLFISSKEDQADTLKGLITMWVDLICANILSLTPSQDRRMWMVFDEVHTLGKLPSLENAQNMSRKYGGCIVIGTQSLEQMAAIYGMDRAKSILGACHSRAFFLCNADTAKWAEQNFGQLERIESSENLSYGPHEFRDGGGVSTKLETRTNVLASQISDLPPLQFYIRFGRGIPNAFVEDKYLQLPSVAEGFKHRPVMVEGIEPPPSCDTPPEPPRDIDPGNSGATADDKTGMTTPLVVASGMLGPLRPIVQPEDPVDDRGSALSVFMGDDDFTSLAAYNPLLEGDNEGAEDEDDQVDGCDLDLVIGDQEIATPEDPDETDLSGQANLDLKEPGKQMGLPLKAQKAPPKASFEDTIGDLFAPDTGQTKGTDEEADHRDRDEDTARQARIKALPVTGLKRGPKKRATRKEKVERGETESTASGEAATSEIAADAEAAE